ncbi:MAG: hypothetical protein IPF92_03225 [Myxococcales bacterium]|nr:hypothetical protein [Myxococcales bacterium]MBL0196721.1 hypothetical protein [Myxococcales bacterium]HQY64488.1 hypothetical protein [Polyangiaceae bacterium]
MLHEIRAARASYDPGLNVTVVDAAEGGGGALRDVSSTLLLDADGLLAGVDLRDGAGRGWVVMLRPHEDVASSRPARVRAALALDGRPATLHVPDVRARGSEMAIL